MAGLQVKALLSSDSSLAECEIVSPPSCRVFGQVVTCLDAFGRHCPSIVITLGTRSGNLKHEVATSRGSGLDLSISTFLLRLSMLVCSAFVR